MFFCDLGMGRSRFCLEGGGKEGEWLDLIWFGEFGV